VIVDLGSTNGTFVNGEPVQRLRLCDGDTVQIGATRLVFHEPRR
jgi:pSer/pThr/pTyr-binding forkhead associated (FHA) protein